MDRDTWFRILELAIVAPYLYTRSEKEKNLYFKVGLKLVAGALMIRALPPLMAKVQPLVEAAQKIAAQQTINKSTAIEGEYTEAKS